MTDDFRIQMAQTEVPLETPLWIREHAELQTWQRLRATIPTGWREVALTRSSAWTEEEQEVLDDDGEPTGEILHWLRFRAELAITSQ